MLGQLAINNYCDEHTRCEVGKAGAITHEVAAKLIVVHDQAEGRCMDCMRNQIGGEKDLVCRLGHALAAPKLATK